jgi:glycopeptide antibiotics resistance protein
VLLGLGVSLLLECVQLAFVIGNFDVDDLLLNTLGTAAGYLCLKLLTRGKKDSPHSSNNAWPAGSA